MTPEQRLALLVAAERAQTPNEASAERGLERLQGALAAHVPPIDIGPIDPTLLAGSTSVENLVIGKAVAGKLVTLPWVAKVTAVVGTVVTSGVLIGNQMSIASAPDQTPAVVVSATATPPPSMLSVGDARAPAMRAVEPSARIPAPGEDGLPPVSHAAHAGAAHAGAAHAGAAHAEAAHAEAAHAGAAHAGAAHERAAPHPQSTYGGNTAFAQSALAAEPGAGHGASKSPASSASVKAFAEAPAGQPSAAQGFDAELVLIGRAKAEFDSGRDHLARVWLNEHAQRFPAGVFAAEREGLLVLSICRSNPSAGQAGALTFQQRYPQSPLAARVRRTCRLE
ncbi:MAG TPA: hypothetical protein VFU02_18450 [Polyangiaceae bacterium]|nr:hypothetical protein [Polyangiaceae bacterium]